MKQKYESVDGGWLLRFQSPTNNRRILYFLRECNRFGRVKEAQDKGGNRRRRRIERFRHSQTRLPDHSYLYGEYLKCVGRDQQTGNRITSVLHASALGDKPSRTKFISYARSSSSRMDGLTWTKAACTTRIMVRGCRLLLLWSSLCLVLHRNSPGGSPHLRKALASILVPLQKGRLMVDFLFTTTTNNMARRWPAQLEAMP